MRQRFIQSFSTSGTEQTAIDNKELGKPYVAYIQDGRYIDWNRLNDMDYYKTIPLTFRIMSGGTISWVGEYQPIFRTIEYQKNDGLWVEITADRDNPPTIPVAPGDIVRFKGENDCYGYSGYVNGVNRFGADTNVRFKVEGNIMSLFYGDDFLDKVEFPELSGYYTPLYGIFRGNTGVVSAEYLVLPATTLLNSCYLEMFKECTNLSGTAPELLANTLVDACYKYMFYQTNVSKIKCLATNVANAPTAALNNWVYGVPDVSTSVFVKHPNATWSRGSSGIPNNWTVIDADI